MEMAGATVGGWDVAACSQPQLLQAELGDNPAARALPVASGRCASGGAGQDAPAPAVTAAAAPGRRKQRRLRPVKNEEEVESQRMIHIAVERNRRKQMNEYLAALRSLMPPAYSQRVTDEFRFPSPMHALPSPGNKSI
ncbi:uncharacterized protein LOC8074346 [Sorghum bicolor]|uniref:uncharacterized protein LOC8074346 n=1 Tax=Sorghum bicolor TaxID=4558 RepID=UPI000B42551C|nr:uncharacterized protein LOC8074346 [Sorghum bicolor]|eukprot:XP_021317816.1 uncharacterized protein LOC8074346 [Sorghum bicolor]